ncbi:MAG: alanine--glyoxylate aminotransferase family protein [Candidatus Nezhaarchaeota archaeon]|nr:alanine--glyoxylate aminotransferase family protein [Candidatus Nezhaarchaeota archaeon]MCX8141627.1 alanine--glyoxylate aminotransferase family protein [Candidatus Nezhaarchaeota archaeon]MDW8049894.1 alanine--glyoxylate aminotransferase family protein [Nitrososphaerota archaeon]
MMSKLLMIPGPTNVPPRVLEAMNRPIVDHRGPEFEALYTELLENLKYYFQTSWDVIPFTASGTGAIESVISNTIVPGDKVLVPLYGNFTNRIKDVVEVYGGKTVTIKVPEREAVTAEQIEEALAREKVKLVFVVFNETSTGVVVRDLEKISEIVHEHGALIAVDAISGLGGDELPVGKWQIDFCISASQKCLAAPPGVSMVSVSDRAWEVIKSMRPRSHYFDLMYHKKFFLERRQTPFTPAVQIFAAVNEALKLLKEEGLENRIKRHKVCAEAFYKAIESMNLACYAKPEFRSRTVIAFEVPKGLREEDIRRIMREKYNIYIAGGMADLRGKIIRIGSMGIVDQSIVMTTISALECTLKELGHNLEVGAGIEAALKVFSSS